MTAQAFLTLATAFGLSTAAGLNAYIPLFLVALLARTTSLVTLNEPYTTLSSWGVIATLAVLLLIEILVDKIPAVDTVNDVIQTFVRPAAGAILFAASTNNIIGLHPTLAAICGVVIAGGVHIAKTVERPVVTAATAGIGDPVVSTVEDAVSFITSVIAVVAPYLIVALAVTAISLLIWWAERRGRRPHR